MQQFPPSAKTIKRSQISIEQSFIDLGHAKSALKNAPEKSALHSMQAAINAMGACLEAQGYFQLPAYSAMEMQNSCMQLDGELFHKIKAPCYVLDGLLQKDLFGAKPNEAVTFTTPFAKALLRAAKKVTEISKTYLKSL